MVGYLIHFFPLYSSTFITDEIDEMRRQGAQLTLFAVLNPKKTEYPADFSRFYQETTFVFPMQKFPFLWRHLAALLRKPLGYLKCLSMIFTHPGLGIKNRIRTLYHFAEAIYLYPEIKSKGCSHLHVHFMVGTGTIAVFLNWIYGLPYSLTGHGGDIFEDRVLQAEKIAYSRFTRLGTEYNAAFLRRLLPETHRNLIHVIPFGIDRTKIPPLESFSDLNSDSKNLVGGTIRLLTVGRLVWEKAQNLLMEACALAVAEGLDFHLRIVGEGPLRFPLEEQIRNLYLESKVTLLGALPPEAVWQEYRNADLFILSSISEGSPFVIMEAMACGLPVIVPALRGIPEMVRDGVEGLLFKTGSAQRLGEAMIEIMSNPPLLKKLALAAEAGAKERFDQIESITQFHNLLRTYVKTDA